MPSEQPTPETLAGLRSTTLFQGLSDPDLAAVYQQAQIRKIEKEGFFFYQGDPAERIFVLVEGRVKLAQITPDGQQILHRVATEWILFGAVALGQGETYPVTAQAVEDSRALCWAKQTLMDMVLHIPQMALNAMQMMAFHVQQFQDRYRELATERVERRLARTILRLASQTGKRIPQGVLLDFPLTRQDLAEMCGTTLYTVSRILSQWETQGLVSTGREKVIIRQPHALVSLAEDLPAQTS